MAPPFTPTFTHVPLGPVAGPLQLVPVNAALVSVHTTDGAHVGSLKLVGGVWKFKAMGHDAAGRMEPGHAPLTEQHNMAFAMPDAAEVSARLLGALGSPLREESTKEAGGPGRAATPWGKKAMDLLPCATVPNPPCIGPVAGVCFKMAR